MALKIGNNAVANAFVGSSQVRRAYKGGTLVFQAFSPASEQEFIQKEATGGPAQLLKVYGKSIVWNQLMASGDTLSVDNSEGTSAVVIHSVDADRTLVPKHKYLCAANFNGQATSDTEIYMGYLSPVVINLIQNPAIITSGATSIEKKFGIYVRVPAGGSIHGTITPVVIDLTILYGEGHEPTSVAQFEADYPEYDPTYDPGSLQSNKTTELRAERIPVINVWDEEWRRGYYDVNGIYVPAPTGNYISSSNSISVSPSTAYFVKHPLTVFLVVEKDANGNVLSRYKPTEFATYDSSFTTSANTRFIEFCVGSSAFPITTYNHDICINLSDPAINGQYYSHWRGSLALNLSTLTGKLNGEGASVVVFPDGLRGVGTARDAAYGSTGVVRFGKRAYQAGDESDTSVLTDGTNTIYPLATPLTYTLDTPLPTDLTCEQGDILQRVSGNNCPFVGEMKFGL